MLMVPDLHSSPDSAELQICIFNCLLNISIWIDKSHFTFCLTVSHKAHYLFIKEFLCSISIFSASPHMYQFSLALFFFGGFPGATSGKKSSCQCRRHKKHGFNPWVGMIPWRRKWQPAPISCLENSMDIGAWWAIVHRVAKRQTWLSNSHLDFHFYFSLKDIYLNLHDRLVFTFLH